MGSGGFINPTDLLFWRNVKFFFFDLSVVVFVRCVVKNKSQARQVVSVGLHPLGAC